MGGGNIRRLMFPDSDDDPSRVREATVSVKIPGSVGFDLRRPELRVLRRGRAIVLGAAVPEAPVNEDGDTCSGEHDVSGSPQLGYRSNMEAVAEA
jgi:hypothetical protein